jgi:hypothetical protein
MAWVETETVIELQPGIVVAIGVYIQFENVQFPSKKSISVSACYSKINERCLDE